MKTLYLSIIVLFTVASSSGLAYAEQPLLDFYNNSQLVLVGKVISLSQVASTTNNPSQSPNQTRYDIQVEQYYKNPQDAKLITVYGYAKGIYFSQDPTYDIGNRVFLYVNQENGHYQIQPNSFVLHNNCDARPMIPLSTLPFESPPISAPAYTHIFDFQSDMGTSSDTFLIGNKIHISFVAENYLPVAKSATLIFSIKTENNTNLIFNDTKQITFPACSNKATVSWDFIPKSPGTYFVNVSMSGSMNLGTQTVLFTDPSVASSFDVRENMAGGTIDKAPHPPSPLQQFKSGISASDVKCASDFQLVLKTEDVSPACVKPDTAQILIERGWAKEVSHTSLNTMPTISSAPCDDPYPQSNTGVAVLYMSPNSTGKICATYHNPDSPTQSSISIFIAKDMQQQASEITTSANPDIVSTGNNKIVYTIKTGSQAGFYGISFFCNSIPFVVGYDNQSRIILDDFPWLYKNDICLSQTNVFQITGLSGIHVKYVTQVHRN